MTEAPGVGPVLEDAQVPVPQAKTPPAIAGGIRVAINIEIALEDLVSWDDARIGRLCRAAAEVQAAFDGWPSG